jgi:hypothetical protein
MPKPNTTQLSCSLRSLFWESIGLFSILAGFHRNRVLFASAMGVTLWLLHSQRIFGNTTMRDMKVSTELADENDQAPQYVKEAIANFSGE